MLLCCAGGFLTETFSSIRIPPIHLDLRFLLRNIGIKGTLKSIEKQLSIKRDDKIKDIKGKDTPVLWSQFLRGDNEAIKKLIYYNIIDTINLHKLLNYYYNEKIISDIIPFMKEKDEQISFINNSPPDLQLQRKEKSLQYSKISQKIKLGVTTVNYDNEQLLTFNRKNIKLPDVRADNLIRKIKNRDIVPTSVGIDLTGSEKRASGICYLSNYNAKMDLLSTDDEIITYIKKLNPEIVSIVSL